MANVPPGLILIVGGIVASLFSGRLRAGLLIMAPILSGLQLLGFFSLEGSHQQFEFFDYTLTLLRVDKMSLCFALVFHIAAALAVVFSLRVRDAWQSVAALAYAGAAIGAVFAGDLITLFVHWEITAVASAFLIFASRTERAAGAGLRYLVFQAGSGVLLLAGILIHLSDGQSLQFGHIGPGSLGGNLILTAFAIKAAFPLLHTWLTDGYPNGTPTGTVFLSIFTTKMAVYALARGFAGAPGLIWVGAVMAIFPIFYAMVENDLRKVLAYSLISQLGFKVAAVGIGTPMAINGAVAHSFAGIIYLGLLFMVTGALIERTGSARATDLGGLRRAMPWTAAFCLIGAASISGFPFTSGFVSKSLILSAAAHEGHTVLWALLWVAAAATFLHTGIRLPYLAFFAHGKKHPEAREAPPNMLIAMGAAAGLCLAIGIAPRPLLYDFLPFGGVQSPYDLTHVVTQLQLLAFAGLAWLLLASRGLVGKARRGTMLDVDRVYWRLVPELVGTVVGAWRRLRGAATDALARFLRGSLQVVRDEAGPGGPLSRTWLTSTSVVWAAVLLAVFLVLYYVVPGTVP